MDQRIEPKGYKPNWMTIEEGVHRVRNELFAFHGEIGTVYQLMQETYLEEEKCGLTQIDFLNVLYPLLAIQMQSPYSEIIKNGYIHTYKMLRTIIFLFKQNNFNDIELRERTRWTCLAYKRMRRCVVRKNRK